MRKTLLIYLLLVLSACGRTHTAHAQIGDLSIFEAHSVVVCPADESDSKPPDFSSLPCRKGDVTDIDPQGAMIWFRTVVPLKQTRGTNGEPLSLFVSGKMSSEVYLNGTYVGRNGVPGADAASEVPGKMDAELFPLQELFRRGDNEVVLRASSHHGALRLYSPFHMIGIAPAGTFWASGLQHSVVSVATLSLFVLGGLYFGVMAAIGATRVRFATLSAISFFAAGQLVSESLRGLVAYDYPTHDLRLMAIAGFSAAFGLAVSFHVFRTFLPLKAGRVVGGLAVLTLLLLVVLPGFDLKSATGMAFPLIVSLTATGVWTFQGRERAFLYFLSLLAITAAIFVFQSLFLDTVFFLLVALFLLLLFVEQAVQLSKEARERRAEEARANRLELALAEAQQRSETDFVNLKSAGRIERIATDRIVYCKGAGGYTEIVLDDNKMFLQTASLNEMEETLPATFLRVHRSYLINLMRVKSLRRDASGTGTLTLAEDIEVPVSRRTMPRVREALG